MGGIGALVTVAAAGNSLPEWFFILLGVAVIIALPLSIVNFLRSLFSSFESSKGSSEEDIDK